MLALLYDVHGNLPALEAVIEDSQAQGADSYLLGGDYALFGGWPAETVERLEELPAEWIRGNGERWAARPDEAPDDPVVQGAIASCRQALGEERNARLATLPASAPAGEQTRAWHASPVSDVESFFPGPSAEDARLLEGVTDRRLYFGHTHLPFTRLDAATGIELVNPGSVGMPFDGNPRASYALVHDDGTIEPRRVHYDHAAAARKVREIDEPWSQVVATRLERASFVVG